MSAMAHRGHVIPVMMRIVVLCLFGALLVACSGSSRIEDILQANTSAQPTTRQTGRKSQIEDRSAPEAKARTASEAQPQAAQKSTVQSFSEE
jgi:hypothetical protein